MNVRTVVAALVVLCLAAVVLADDPPEPEFLGCYRVSLEVTKGTDPNVIRRACEETCRDLPDGMKMHDVLWTPNGRTAKSMRGEHNIVLVSYVCSTVKRHRVSVLQDVQTRFVPFLTRSYVEAGRVDLNIVRPR